MPIHLLPPWCRAFCSASRWRNVSISFSQPPSDSISFFSSSVRNRSASFLQPFLGDLGLGIGQGLDALEAMPEYPVEAVEMPLVLDERGAREKVELLDVEAATRLSIASIKVRYSRSETGTLAARNSGKNEKNIGYSITGAESGFTPSHQFGGDDNAYPSMQ